MSQYKYICVLDFEAVFAENPQDARNYPMEIIEFPSVLYEFVEAEKGRIELVLVDEFQSYVKTRRIPVLNDFCMKQTGISQQMVDDGESFEKVLSMHTEWLFKHLGMAPRDQNVLMVTCGDWDLKKMLPHQLHHEGLSAGSHLKQWCNVKWVYEKFYRKKKVNGMLTMLNGLKLGLIGKHHSGIDDCRNIGRVVCEMVKQGCSFAPTGKHGSQKVIWLSYDPACKLNNFVLKKLPSSQPSTALSTSQSTSSSSQQPANKKKYSRVQR